MPRVASYRVAWSTTYQAYQLQETQNQGLLDIEPESQAWFTWLDLISSFSFSGKSGHFTACKESRPRGDAYWYAYLGTGKKRVKRYLGKTGEVTLVRLEGMAEELSTAHHVTVRMLSEILPARDPTSTSNSSLAALRVAGGKATEPITQQPRTHSQHDPLLATKLHMPRPRSKLVQRSHLVEQLQQGVEQALTLVSAPAGFGKTTLLAQWLAQSEMPVAWLSLEPEDNDPVRFLTYLIAALQMVDAQLGATALELLHMPQPPPPETLVALLTNDLMRSTAGDFALILDDYHVITAEPIHRILTALLEHLPPQLHLVLSTRSDPPLPLARLRARGQLAEVRAAELRLNPAETEIFLRVVMGLDLLHEAIVALERRTEGWVAGLQLAALSLRGKADISTFLATFTGGHRFILDYLTEEVVSQQPVSIQSFLLHTSILGRLSASLCEAVTGQQQSQAILETLERANLFVVALDDERQWYRYHHLFADVLRNRLQQTQPTLISELHQRASDWYEEHNLPAEAIQHALAAPDFERAARLIERVYISIALRGQISTLLGWLNRLPDTLIRTHAFLCIYYANMLMFTNQLEESETRLQDAERCVHPDTPAEQAKTILGYVALIRGYCCRYIGDLTRFVMLAKEALDQLPETEKAPRASAMMNTAHSYLLSGDVTPETHHLVQTSISSVRAAGNPFQVLRSLTLLARLQVLQGRLREAAATYERVEQDALEQKALRLVANSTAYYFGLGDLLRERNKLDEASRCLTDGMELVKGTLTVFADEVTLGSIAQARLQLARGEYNQALAALDAFADLANHRHFVPQLLAQVGAVRSQVELAQGNLRAAIRWAEECGLSPDDSELAYPREREYLTLARLRIAQGHDDPAGPFLKEALFLLDRLLADAEAKNRMASTLEILILRALSLYAQGDRKTALATMQRALTMAESEGYIRLFVDEGTPMLNLLRQAQTHGMAPDYVATLLSAFGEPADTIAPRPAVHTSGLIEPLTERECEVLYLLAEGASNREIARRLVLSIGTVKKYVYNICGKLGVQSRTQALARARALHLL